jgi:hypothetical protein
VSGHSCGGTAFRISVKAAIGIPKFYPSTLRFNQCVFPLCRELRNQPLIIFIEPSILSSLFSKYAIDHFSGDPLDFSRQVKYSCVISLSAAAATSGVLKKNAAPITITFLVHGRFGIIVTLHTLISDLHTRHRPSVIEIVVAAGRFDSCISPPAPNLGNWVRRLEGCEEFG